MFHVYRPKGKLPIRVLSTDLMILDLAPHNAEGVVARVVVDVDSAEARGAARWDPLLIGIVVHHDGGSRLADTLFTAGTQRHKQRKPLEVRSTQKQNVIWRSDVQGNRADHSQNKTRCATVYWHKLLRPQRALLSSHVFSFPLWTKPFGLNTCHNRPEGCSELSLQMWWWCNRYAVKSCEITACSAINHCYNWKGTSTSFHGHCDHASHNKDPMKHGWQWAELVQYASVETMPTFSLTDSSFWSKTVLYHCIATGFISSSCYNQCLLSNTALWLQLN